MRLHYDYYSGRYTGERYGVDEWTFLQALQSLIMAGCEPEAALDRVLDESAWSDTIEGVTLLPAHPRCHFCEQHLLSPRQAFCDVRCEAALIVDLLQQAR
ncbi:MAG: hypothetical protein ACYDCQ_15790 [Dehalococcoidia bacterium]